MRYFVTVAEELHFGRAAERLHMAQQPLSAQVQTLERELDCILFIRGANRLRLTAAGEVFLREATAVLAHTEQAVALTQRAARGEVGIVRIGGCAAALHHIVPTTVRALKERCPSLGIWLREMSWYDQQAALDSGQIDFGFTYRPEDESNFVIESLIGDRFFVALPAGHRLARRPILAPRDLVDEPFVAMEPHLNACARPTARILAEGGSEHPVAFEVADRASALGLVGAGLGFTVLPGLAALPFPNVAYVVLDTPKRMQLATLWSRRADDTVMRRQFIETVRDLVASGAFESLPSESMELA